MTASSYAVQDRDNGDEEVEGTSIQTGLTDYWPQFNDGLDDGQEEMGRGKKGGDGKKLKDS